MQLQGSGWSCVHAAVMGRCRAPLSGRASDAGVGWPGRPSWQVTATSLQYDSRTAHTVAPGRSCLSPDLAQKPHGLVPADSLRQLDRETAQTPGVVDGAHPTMGWESEKVDRILQALVLPEFLQAAT